MCCFYAPYICSFKVSCSLKNIRLSLYFCRRFLIPFCMIRYCSCLRVLLSGLIFVVVVVVSFRRRCWYRVYTFIVCTFYYLHSSVFMDKIYILSEFLCNIFKSSSNMYVFFLVSFIPHSKLSFFSSCLFSSNLQ